MKHIKTYKVFEITKPPGAYYSNLSSILSNINIDGLEITNIIKDSLITLEDKNYEVYVDTCKVKLPGLFQKKEIPGISIHIDIPPSKNRPDRFFYINEIEDELLSFENHIKSAGSKILEISCVCQNPKSERLDLDYGKKFKTLDDLLKSKYHYMSITIKVFLDINIEDYI